MLDYTVAYIVQLHSSEKITCLHELQLIHLLYRIPFYEYTKFC